VEEDFPTYAQDSQEQNKVIDETYIYKLYHKNTYKIRKYYYILNHKQYSSCVNKNYIKNKTE